MQFQKKALYNLLRLNSLEDSSLQCEPWQVESLRDTPIANIFGRLSELGIDLDEKKLCLFAEHCDSPEEMAACFFSEKQDEVMQDKVYLLIFELWRRLFPERQSLSIFCDELDMRIYLYDHQKLENDELIQNSIANLKAILEENVDAGIKHTKIFQSISEYCAHDIENFLFDYIDEQLDVGNELYATDLLDGFSPYVCDKKWFDLLRFKLICHGDIVTANEIIKNLVKEMNANVDIDFQLDILRAMILAGDSALFIKIVKKTLPFIKIEEDFLELMEISAEFFRRLDKEKVEKEILILMANRNETHLEKEVVHNDILSFQKLLVK